MRWINALINKLLVRKREDTDPQLSLCKTCSNAVELSNKFDNHRGVTWLRSAASQTFFYSSKFRSQILSAHTAKQKTKKLES